MRRRKTQRRGHQKYAPLCRNGRRKHIVKNIRYLVKVVHGSHLFGTSTPTSDQDYKGVHLPSGQAIILQRPENVIDRSIKAKLENGKNSEEAVDYQSYSLDKFARMLMDGDGVAMEVLYANDEAIVEMDPEWPAIREECKKLITREIKGFVGYCKQQAAKYGIKGSRMEAVEKLNALIAKGIAKHGEKARLEVMHEDLVKFVAEVEMATLENVQTPHGKFIMNIECCERKMSYRNKLIEVQKVFGAVWKNYGKRAESAKTNDGIDWKAISHAVRVARQAHEMLQTKTITFPRPDAAELVEIKLGKQDYKKIQPVLEALVDDIDRIASSSPLPETVDPEVYNSLILKHYLSQI